MKNTIIYLFIAIFIFSFSNLEQFDNAKEINQVEKLLNKRIHIINRFLYANKNLEMLKKVGDELSKIEDKKLLETDMSILTHIYYNATEYDRTKAVAICKVKKIEVTKTSVVMLAKLEWNIISGNEFPIETSLIKDYNINCIFKNNKMYLTNMEFVE